MSRTPPLSIPTQLQTPQPPPLRGFSLVEMILALGIFALLAGAVFISVQAITTASVTLAEEQMRARRMDAFLTWCRRGFRAVPPRALLILRTRDTGPAGLAVELILRRSPGAFSLGEWDARGPDLVLAALPDGKGTATLAIARFPGAWSLDDLGKNLRDQDWLPLLEGIRTLRWSFWDPVAAQFVEQWPPDTPLPELVRLQMRMATGEEVDSVFRIPRLTFRGQIPEADNQDENPDPSAPQSRLPTKPHGHNQPPAPSPLTLSRQNPPESMGT